MAKKATIGKRIDRTLGTISSMFGDFVQRPGKVISSLSAENGASGANAQDMIVLKGLGGSNFKADEAARELMGKRGWNREDVERMLRERR